MVRNTQRVVLALVVSLALLSARPALAQVAVGQPVQLDMKSIDGQSLTSKNLQGKIIILDFWATWCGPCMAEVPHMAKINDTLGPKGVQIIGISRDDNVAVMKPVIAAQGMKWLHVHAASDQLAQMFGVNSIPRVFVISPDGVLRWTGHPARMDAPLAEVLAKYPPVLVDPKVVTAAREQLTEVDKKLEGGDAKGALKLMARVPEDASKDPEFAKAADETRARLDDAAKEMLKAADDDAAAGKYKEAAQRLRELSLSLSGLPVGEEAKKKLGAMMSKPEVKQAVEAAQKEAQAATALDAAKKLRDAKKHEQAYEQFKLAAKAFAGTPSGDDAAKAAKAYESDAAFMKRITDQQVGGKAKAALSVARSYAGAGRKEQAKKKYESIIAEYPNTDYAKTAQAELNAMKK
jgi:thiol-disulfide isomerase/thioredoxin